MFFNKFNCLYEKTHIILVSAVISIAALLIVIFVSENSEEEACLPKRFDDYLNGEENNETDVNTDTVELRRQVRELNERRRVSNEEEFGPAGPGTPLLVVTSRGRLPGGLLRSLPALAGVEELLLVVSHARPRAAAERLLRAVDYCMLLQIYFPHPADDKLHWWWTARFVFERLPWTPAGAVVFVDDDSYVLPDLLFVLASAKHAMSLFPAVDVISLGRGAAGGDYERLAVEAWRAADERGLAFTRRTWARVSSLGALYCEHDDASWSRSLQRVFSHFSGGSALALAARAPRVLLWPREPELCLRATFRRLFQRRVRAAARYDRAGRLLAPPPLPQPPRLGWLHRARRDTCYNIVGGNNVTMVLPER